MAREHLGVEAAQELDGVQVLAPAIAVWNPTTFRTAVVEIEHRGDGVDAQSIDRVAIEPEQAAVEQKIRHLDAAEVIDERVPVEVTALLGVDVLVERRSVEPGKPVRIVREM